MSKVFGPRQQEALALTDQGLSRAEVQRMTGATVAVHGVSFRVDPGELFVVMGLSGSGKSTLVRLLNRLIEPSAGTVEVDGRRLDLLDDHELRQLRNRRMSMVFQHFALFPHRTVGQNVGYGLHVRGASAEEVRERTDWALEAVGLADRAQAYPDELSGGMKQRVGLARALATDSDALLMDEAFSALDPLIRREMQELLEGLQSKLHKTIVFITHDLNEAMRLGDRILMLNDGRLVQIGTGPEILAAPADRHVADFVSDVDRARVLTAADVCREPRLVARPTDPPGEALARLAAAESNGMYVLDDQQRIVGVTRDDLLARAVQHDATTLPADCIVDDYLTTGPDKPLIDIIRLLGRNSVPLAVVDDDGTFLGVVPRAVVLDALAAPYRR